MKKNKYSRSRSSRWEHTSPQPPAGQWFITGMNGVLECLRSPHVQIKAIWVERSVITPELWKLMAPLNSLIRELKNRDTSYGEAVQGIAALVTQPEAPDVDVLLDGLSESGRSPLLVALDQVEDPMNLGQILRTCDGAGVDALLVLKHRSVHMNRTAAQVSQGAFAWVPVIEVVNLRQALESFKKRGIWVIGCEAGPKSKPWHQCDLTDGVVLIFGAEGKGLRDLTRKTCDHLARLPMNGRLDSLNVSAATAAFLYEAARQRAGASRD